MQLDRHFLSPFLSFSSILCTSQMHKPTLSGDSAFHTPIHRLQIERISIFTLRTHYCIKVCRHLFPGDQAPYTAQLRKRGGTLVPMLMRLIVHCHSSYIPYQFHLHCILSTFRPAAYHNPNGLCRSIDPSLIVKGACTRSARP